MTSNALVLGGPSHAASAKTPKENSVTVAKGANVWLSLTTPVRAPTPKEAHEFEQKQVFRPLGEGEHALARIRASTLRKVIFESPIFIGTPLGRSVADKFISEVKAATPGVRKIIGSDAVYFAVLQMCRYIDSWSEDIRTNLHPRSTLMEYGLLPSLDGTVFTSTDARKELMRIASMSICIDQIFASAVFWSRKETAFKEVAKKSRSYQDDVTNLREQSHIVYQLPRDSFARGTAAFSALDCLEWRKMVKTLTQEQVQDTPVPPNCVLSQIATIAIAGSLIGDQQERRGAAVGSVNRFMFNLVTACGRTRVSGIIVNYEHFLILCSRAI